MDFLDPNKKRAHRIKLYIGYGLVAILIGVATMILLFAASGYGIDSGKVIQNGLVFFNSKPGGAEINVEGLHNKFKQGGRTDTRMVLREGHYKATITKDGYRSWQRQFSLEGGEVARFVYPFLFPEKLETSVVRSYDSQPSVVTQSPSRQWLVVQRPDVFTTFDVYDANDPTKSPTSFSVPANILSQAETTQKLEEVEWSTDNSNILFKHSYDDKTEFVVINRNKPEESINVNDATGQNPYNVVLKDKKIDRLYLHMSQGGLLQEVEIKTNVLTPLVASALAFQPHGDDMLVYVTRDAAQTDKASVRILTKEKDYELRELPGDTTYVVDVARFDNSWYVVAGAASDNRVYIYRDPLERLMNRDSKEPIFARSLRIENPRDVSFSANARMIAAQSGQRFAVYDAETDRQYRYTINEPIDTGRAAEWMDGHRLVTSTEKTVLVFDFDGINLQRLMPIVPSVDSMFDRDYELAYSLAEDGGRFNLTRTKLLAED